MARPTSFITELSASDWEQLIIKFKTIIDFKEWKNRISLLKTEIERYPFLSQFYNENFKIELGFGKLLDYKSSTGRYPTFIRDAKEYAFFSFILIFVQVHRALGSDGKKRLLGSIQSQLENDSGVAPIAYEMRIIGYLSRHGFKIELNDLENGGGYDFLATHSGVEIEVECKHLSADVGRQVHRKKFHSLAKTLHLVIENALDHCDSAKLITVTVPGRLNNNHDHQMAIAHRIKKVLSTNTEFSVDENYSVNLSHFRIEESPFSLNLDEKEFEERTRQYLESSLKIDRPNLLTYWRPGRSAIIVHVRSKKTDNVLRTISKRLREDTRNQFTGKKQSLLFVHLANSTRSDLKGMHDTAKKGMNVGIQQVINEILSKRIHVQ